MKHIRVLVLILIVTIIVAEITFLFFKFTPFLEEQESTNEALLRDDEEVVTDSLSTTTSQSIEETNISPNLKVTFTSPAKESDLFEQSADVFVVNDYKTTGRDSRTDRTVVGKDNSFERTTDGTTMIEVNTSNAYVDRIDISVVGLLSGPYELSIVLTDGSGERHEFLYASSTREQVMDTYSVNLISGEIKVGRTDYSQKKIWLELEDSGGTCEADALKQQLTDLLTDNGWDMNTVPLVNTEVGFMKGFDFLKLPFGMDKVCAVRLTFREDFLDEIPEAEPRRNFVQFVPHSDEIVVVGGESFGQYPGDGPLGSVNTVPITLDGKGLQFLQVLEQTSLIPVNFPAFSVCPCAHEYQAVLTAPMYP